MCHVGKVPLVNVNVSEGDKRDKRLLWGKKNKEKKIKNYIKPTLAQVQQGVHLCRIIHLDEQKACKATQTARELLVGMTVDWGDDEAEEKMGGGGVVGTAMSQ